MSNILMLEPDILLGRNARDVLKKSGHQVGWHRSGQSAISAIDKSAPDLIITELQLTAHSGLEFLYELRSYPEWQSIPLIIYSHLRPLSAELDVWTPFNVVAYHYKPETKLQDLARSVEQTLAVV